MNAPFPLRPRSTKSIEQGQFWALPLDSGGYGCGVVLAKASNQGKTDSRLFLAGLISWFGNDQPTLEQIQGSKVIESGFAHIKSISETGGEILGGGFQVLDLAEKIEISNSFRTWGYSFIIALANKHAKDN